MNYEKMNVPCREENGCCPEATANLMSMMDYATELTVESLGMAYKINAHMFGIEQAYKDEKPTDPKSFRDGFALELTALKKLHDELALMVGSIGI